MRNCHTLTTVSVSSPSNSDIRAHRLVVVKQYRNEDEYFDNGDESEDSDCESGLDQAGHFETEAEIDSREDSGQGHLPVLSFGSFAR